MITTTPLFTTTCIEPRKPITCLVPCLQLDLTVMLSHQREIQLVFSSTEIEGKDDARSKHKDDDHQQHGKLNTNNTTRDILSTIKNKYFRV